LLIPPNIPPPMTGCFWILLALSGSRDLKKALGHRPANCRQKLQRIERALYGD
jgi:hypothetical protein